MPAAVLFGSWPEIYGLPNVGTFLLAADDGSNSVELAQFANYRQRALLKEEFEGPSWSSFGEPVGRPTGGAAELTGNSSPSARRLGGAPIFQPTVTRSLPHRRLVGELSDEDSFGRRAH